MGAVVAIMAKYPHGTDVKTRLSQRLSSAERAQLYEAFLADKLRSVRELPEARCAIVYTPADRKAWFERFAGTSVALYAQVEGALGARLVAAFQLLLRRYPDGVILTDSDTPNLPREFLAQALAALQTGRELVLGPAEDGGYYLVGLTRPLPGLFDGVPWSTAEALAHTLGNARRLGTEPHLLPRWRDVDESADLDHLANDVMFGRGAPCPHTEQALHRLGLLRT